MIPVDTPDKSRSIPSNFSRRMSKETRKPFGSMDQKLAYPVREGYHRHWFNDDPGRIDAALEAGYTHVLDKEGRKVQRVVGVSAAGGGLIAFLMEIPQEWYDDDMKRGQAKVDEMDKAIRRGTVTEKEGDGRYVPSRGIVIKEGR